MAHTNPENRINCYKCRHFYITWENDHPYGCRAMGFKSKQLPSIVVFSSSGNSCMMFAPKTKNHSDNS